MWLSGCGAVWLWGCRLGMGALRGAGAVGGVGFWGVAVLGSVGLWGVSGCGTVGLWGCVAVELSGCGAVGLGGCGAGGLWGWGCGVVGLLCGCACTPFALKTCFSNFACSVLCLGCALSSKNLNLEFSVQASYL